MMINYSCYFAKLYTKIKFDPCVKKDAILSGINPNIFPPPEIRSLMPNVKRMKIARTGVTTKAFFYLLQFNEPRYARKENHFI